MGSMAVDHAVFTSDYLLGTQAVAQAGRRLQKALGADRTTLDYAITRLERAAELHESGGASLRKFMFAEMETAAEPKAVRHRAAEDTLAGVLADVQVGNVLIAAGQAAGEAGKPPPTSYLDESLLRLEKTTNSLEKSLPSPMAATAEPGRFGFAEEPGQVAVVHSADLPTAIASFRKQSQDTLDAIVQQAKGVADQAIAALTKLDKDKIVAALGKLGQPLAALPKIGRLLQWGLAKIQSAISALIRLLGSEALAKVQAQVEKIWNDAVAGKYTDAVLKWAFQVDGAESFVQAKLAKDGLQLASIDEGSNNLPPLVARCKDQMAIAGGLVSAVTIGGTILSFTPLAGPALALAMASAYVLIAGAVVLLGMDYVGSVHILNWVRGVRDIAANIQPA